MVSALRFWVDQVFQVIVVAINDGFYKLNAESLACVSVLCSVIRPSVSEPLNPQCTNQRFRSSFLLGSSYAISDSQSVQALFQATLAKLRAIDADQEVKEKAIVAMAHLLATTGDQFSAEDLNTCWALFLARLQNVVCREISKGVMASHLSFTCR